MDDRPPVWDSWNRKHIELDHPERKIARSEVNQVLRDPKRKEIADVRATDTYYNVIGQTKSGRLLLVVWVDHPIGRYPVHVRQAGRKLGRRYYE